MSSSELFGNDNYDLYAPAAGGGLEVLTGVSVTIVVLEDIIAIPIAPSAGGQQSNGVGFQLNCRPLTSQTVTNWQQYVINLSRTGQKLGWMINNWNSGGGNGFVNLSGPIASIPSDLPAGYAHIPAGYTFVIALSIDPTTSNVTGATFTASYIGAAVAPPVSVQITAPGNLNTLNNQQLTSADLSPIADITLNIVGYANRANTLLTSGAGGITYTATQSLVTAGAPPVGVYFAGEDDETGEQSNATYGELAAGPSTTFTQTFGYQPGSSYIAVASPSAALELYSQPIGGSAWVNQQVAGPSSAYSAPALTFANYELAPWIAVQGPTNSLTFYYLGNSQWNAQNVAVVGTTFSAPSIAQFNGNYICIAAQGANNSLMLYWQLIGGTGWQPQTVATADNAFSAPSLAQIDNSACIAVQGPGNSLDFYWQAMGGPGWPGTGWNKETVVGADWTFSAPSLAQVGNSSCIAAQGPDDELLFYWQTIGSPIPWSPGETVAGLPLAGSAPSLAQIGNSACIAAQSPDNALTFYSQTIGANTWNTEILAVANTTFSAPSLAQIGNSACIAVQGSSNSITFYWQTIGANTWNPETVPLSATELPGSLAIGPPLAPPGG
jgi:hypothetical protein